MAISELTDLALADAAVEAAEQAARRAGVMIRALVEQAHIDAAAQLLSEIWEVGENPLVPANLLRAMSHSNNYVSGAFVDGRLVGTSVGFLGSRDGHLHLHSHVTGVTPEMQGRSVGFALKQHQRTWAIDHDLDKIEWTFDPLVGRNAYFNITKLGAEIVDYKRNFYGDMDDGINADDDSDRCVVVWRIASARAVLAAEGRQEDAAIDSATAVLTESESGEPHVTRTSGNPLLAYIPRDIVEMRRQAPEAAAAWRQALRDVFETSFAEGYVVTGMTRTGGYVLTRAK